MVTIHKYREFKAQGLVSVRRSPSDPTVIQVLKARFDPETGERLDDIIEGFKLTEMVSMRDEHQSMVDDFKAVIQDIPAQ